MKHSHIIISALIAAFCLCAGMLLGFLLGRQVGLQPQTEDASAVPMVEIFVAAQPIEQALILNEEMLATISIPESEVTEAMIWSYDSVLGCAARYDISQGTPLARWMIYCFDDPLPSPALK